MVDIIVFPTHQPLNPPVLFFLHRERFLRNGSVEVFDGLVTDENGLTTTYTTVRPLGFKTTPDDPYRTSLVDVGEAGLYPLQFSGGRVTLRSASPETLLLASSPAMQFVGGRVTIGVDIDAWGALTRFAAWDITQPQEDPVNFYVEDATNEFSGNTDEPWTRHHAIFVPHKKTRYLAVGSKIFDLPHTNPWRSQFFKKWMVEKLEVSEDAPSDRYYPARELELIVKADRVNWFPYPTFNTATITELDPHLGETVTSENGHLTVARTTSRKSIGFVWNPATPMKPGTWAVSFLFTPTVPHTVSWAAVNPNLPGDPLVYSTSVRCPAGVTTRVGGVLDDVDPNAGVLFYAVADTARPVGEPVEFDNVLVERTGSVQSFFHGASSGDTLWEEGGTPWETRSYLYKNRTGRYAALLRALELNVPMGVYRGAPRFAVYTYE